MWSPPPLARDRRSSPPGFILPCQPTLAFRVPTSSVWIHEIKHDGYRMICRREGDKARLWSRTMVSWTEAMPRIVEGIRALPCNSCVLDGEAIVQRPDGLDDFHALRSRAGARHAILFAFDLLELDGVDLRPQSLEARKSELRRLLGIPVDGVAFTDSMDERGEDLFRHACMMGLEGIISKRRDSPYRSGRTQAWLKVKCPRYERR
ncbi:hypothetical protein ABEG18_12900 [Alsobacter sp. KACC 23698]|uniref:ATP-dependent DNA ligase family profile domain-containing protein n=1 Tax=Alsobacter sp. KACC 23698 TaxID=3149229 RepID=A0AAU7JMH3_9HYPH